MWLNSVTWILENYVNPRFCKVLSQKFSCIINTPNNLLFCHIVQVHLIILHIMEELDQVFLLLTLNAFLHCFGGFIVEFRHTIYMVLVPSLLTLNALFVRFCCLQCWLQCIVCVVVVPSLLTLNSLFMWLYCLLFWDERLVCMVLVFSVLFLNSLFILLCFLIVHFEPFLIDSMCLLLNLNTIVICF